MEKVRVRFAPSPTGYLHIGGLRTALYNYLYAKKMGGDFLLRIEDTDRTRYVEGAIENLIAALDWASVKNNEGVMVGENGVYEEGEYGPYIQSDRVKEGIYQKYIDILIEKGLAYYCFCSKERLDEVRNRQKADGLIPRYDGLCRSLSIEEAKKRIAAGEEYVVRLKLPTNEDIEFEDVVKGKITINTSDLDDQVLIKQDGFPTYHFAVVVDDHLMGITHIVRGDEWISSTPKHVFLYDAFGWERPKFVHLPTVLNKQRKKLSKRHDDVSAMDFKDQGYLPEALVNYLALVGWSPDDNEEIMSMDKLIEKFSFDRVSKNGGIFDRDKLNWVNQHYIRALDDEKLKELIKPYLVKDGVIDEDFSDEKLLLIASTFKESLDRLMDITEKTSFVFNGDFDLEEDAKEFIENSDIASLSNAFIEELKEIDEVDEEFSKSVMKKIQKKTGIKGKNLYMPTRAALTGMVHGPEFDKVLLLLRKEEIIKRLEKYI